MGLRSWSGRLDRRAQATARQPFAAPGFFGGAAALGLYGAFVAGSPTMPLTFAAVWGSLGIVSLAARARDQR